MNDFPLTAAFLFPVIAFVYSMAGFAGGSSYLAVLMTSGMPHAEAKTFALFCNVLVSSVVFFNFSKAGHFRLSLVLPFVLFSMPFAFLGANVHVAKEISALLVGLSLFAAASRLFVMKASSAPKQPPSLRALWTYGPFLGAGLGFFSGVIGIGGGIFLSPLLILLGWASLQEASAAASLFIFLNSLSSLWAKSPDLSFIQGPFLLTAVAVLVTGWAGSRLGAARLPKTAARRILAAILAWVGWGLVF